MNAFATLADLAGDSGRVRWLSDDQLALIAGDEERILMRATEVIADATTTGYYVDGDGNATDSDVIAALRDATCAQCEQWLEVGEENDIAGYSRASTMSVGGVNVSSLPAILAPRARRILRLAGLMQAVAY